MVASSIRASVRQKELVNIVEYVLIIVSVVGRLVRIVFVLVVSMIALVLVLLFVVFLQSFGHKVAVEGRFEAFDLVEIGLFALDHLTNLIANAKTTDLLQTHGFWFG